MRIFKTLLPWIYILYIISAGFAESNSEFSDTEAKKDTFGTSLTQQAMANPDYRVFPGDIYQLKYTIDRNVVEYSIIVDSSYIIRVANLGAVNASGKTFMEVKRQVEKLVRQNYPLGVVQFVLSKPSIFTVVVKGEVLKTTEIQAWGLMRVSQVIDGLLTQFASTRYISITSAAGKTTEYDLFKAMREGDLKHDPYVSPGDVITIPRVKYRITLSGAVERPGTYELSDQETVNELISNYGNGFLDGADKTQVKITRLGKDENSQPESFFVSLNKLKPGAVELHHLDTVHVFNKRELQSLVYLEIPIETVNTESSEKNVTGSIIPIPLAAGDDLISIVRQRIVLFTKPWIDTTGAYILRKGSRIFINLNRILFDASYSEIILLEAEDRIIIPALQQTVLVTGAVLKPGSYPYTPGRTFEYYIALAGGFDYQRNTGGAVTIKDVYGKKIGKNDIIGPDTIITARSNAFMYNFNIYAPLITVTATVISAVIAILTFALRK